MTRAWVLLVGLVLLEAAVVAEPIPQSIDLWGYPSSVLLLTPETGVEALHLSPSGTYGVAALLPEGGLGVAHLLDAAPGVFGVVPDENGYMLNALATTIAGGNGVTALASDWGISVLIPAHSNLMPAGLVDGIDLLHSVFAPMQVYGVAYLFRRP